MNRNTMGCRMLSLLLVLLLVLVPAALAEETDVGLSEAQAEVENVQDVVVENPDEEIDLEDTQVSQMVKDALKEIGGMRNILLLGIDARPGEKTGRSDTMIVVTVDSDNNVIRLVSLMRDLYVEIPGRKNNRLNAAYIFGGADLLMETIELNFGIHCEDYIAVNFSMLAKVIDQLGGLELTVESDYYKDRINAVIKCDNAVLGIDVNDGLLKKDGTQLMTGKQAQAYARYRYGTKDGDFGRTARQREVILKIFEKLNSYSVLELMQLAYGNIDNVYTSMSIDEIVKLAPAVLGMQNAEIRQLRIPVDGGYESKTVSKMSVLVPNRTKTKEAIAEFYKD